MSKRLRQYAGLAIAIGVYYVLHEGAHLLTALCLGVPGQVRLLGLGVQVDVLAGQMTDPQMGLFCLAGAISTLTAGYVLTLLRRPICRRNSKLLRSAAYYTTLALLLTDPLYLSLLCPLFGGGDMNGIRLLLPEGLARGLFGALFLGNGWLFWRCVLPAYTRSFHPPRQNEANR